MKYDIIGSDHKDLSRFLTSAENPYIIFLNDNYLLRQNTIDMLEEYINISHGDFVAFEMAVTPVESGKHYDPVTLETDVINNFCFAVSKQAFNAVGGFDYSLPLYCRVTDLSRRLKAAGGKLMYCPKATIVSAASNRNEKEEYLQKVYSNLLWAYKYGDNQCIRNRNTAYINTLKKPKHFENIRKDLLKMYLKHFFRTAKLKKFRKKNPQVFSLISGQFPSFAYRGTDVTVASKGETLVSVVIRTHKRPSVLKKTLESLTHQLYRNFEVVVIEDGENTAEALMKEFAQSLNIRYYSTGEHVGRGKAGNTGIEKADGEYIIFLDDDDYYYADCISSFVSKFSQHPEAEMVISGGMAFKCLVQSTDPYIYTATEIYPILFDHITLMDMCVRCRIPMPCCMFKKDLYYRHGGMREDIGGDEDWAMWLKFMKDAVRINPCGPDIPKALSMFGYPADEAAAKKREEDYRIFDKIMLYDESMSFTVTAEEIQKWENYVQADINHLKNIGALDGFIADLKPLGIEKIEYQPEGTYTLTAKQINNYYYWLVYDFADIEKP